MTAGFSLRQSLRDLGTLLRWRLAAMNGIAALSGTFLFPLPPAPWSIAGLFAGTTLLAGGASALNQLQERNLDGQMERTCQRPLPTGRLTPRAAAMAAALALVCGGAILFAAGGLAPVAVACVILFCYHGLYTPLKRHTALAVIPGAVAGALPPILGWNAAGGVANDPRILLLAGLFLLWQLPHVWLLQRRHGDDLRRAGQPTLADLLGSRTLVNLCRLWIGALMAGALLLPAFGLLSGLPAWAYLTALTLFFPLPAWDASLLRRLQLFPLLLATSLFMQRFLN